jgi:DNA-binding transcriptional MerR regulator
MSSLPPKLYFRIGEVAGLVGVEPHVLRYWEREFRSIRPTKSAKGQRVYSRRDVENLMRVRDLLYAEGFTIAGAKKKLQKSGAEAESEGGPLPAIPARAPGAPLSRAPAGAASVDLPTSPQVRAALAELRTEIEAFLAELGG